MDNLFKTVLITLARWSLNNTNNNYTEHKVGIVTWGTELANQISDQVSVLNIDGHAVGIQLICNTLNSSYTARVAIDNSSEPIVFNITLNEMSVTVISGTHTLAFSKIFTDRAVIVHTEKDSSQKSISYITCRANVEDATVLTVAEISMTINDKNFISSVIQEHKNTPILSMLFSANIPEQDGIVICRNVLALTSPRLHLYAFDVGNVHYTCSAEVYYGKHIKLITYTSTDVTRVCEICKCHYSKGYEVLQMENGKDVDYELVMRNHAIHLFKDKKMQIIRYNKIDDTTISFVIC